MKVKKIILSIICLTASFTHPVVVHHTLTSVTEQKVLGHMFKHVITSGGVEKDEFFIDGYAVSKDNYYEQFERAFKKEQEEQFARHQAQLRARLQFIDIAQVEIAAKLLHKLVVETTGLLDRIENPALEKFFVFNPMTVESPEQFMQLKMFIQQIEASIQKKMELNDFAGLNLLYTKLESWPSRLEKFFQDTIQYAIKKSDDTAMLKELLKLVSELS